MWDAASGTCLQVLRHHKDPVTCAAWFPDGRRLVTGSHDKQLCVVDLESGAVERQWRIQRIQEVLVAKGGRYILVSLSSGCAALACARHACNACPFFCCRHSTFCTSASPPLSPLQLTHNQAQVPAAPAGHHL